MAEKNGSHVNRARAFWLRGIAIFAFCLVIGATAARIYYDYQAPGKYTNEDEGLVDFHNGIYFPSKAFLNRDNPYGTEWANEYPVDGQIPPYSPITMIIHAPLALLGLHTSEASHFILQIIEVLILSGLCICFASPERVGSSKLWLKKNWFSVLLVSLLVLYSRSGHVTLFNGYFTLEIVIGAILAFQFGHTKPTWAAVGLAIASCKPTYAIPIAILMLCRGHIKAVVIGFVLSVFFAVAGLAWLSSGSSFTEVVQEFQSAQESFREDPNEMPVNSWTRVDLLAFVAKWTNWNPTSAQSLLWMIPIMAVPCWIIFRSSRRLETNKQDAAGVADKQDQHGAAGLIGLVCLLTFITSVFHHYYDVLVLVAPIVGIAVARLPSWQHVSQASRYILLALLLFPLFNYASTELAIYKLGISGNLLHVVTSLNSVSIVLATIYACWLLATNKPESLSARELKG